MTKIRLTAFYRLFVLTLLFCSLQSCVVSKINPKAKDVNLVYFFQNDTSYSIKDEVSELKLKREPFAIHFFNKVYSSDEDGRNITRIVAVPDQEELDKIMIGLDKEQTVNLEKYSALAVSNKTGYNKELFINDYGHHILYYKTEDDRTVDAIGKKGKYLLFQFEVASIFDKPDIVPISETNFDTLYFAIYSDFNKNGIIDSGELTKINVLLE